MKMAVQGKNFTFIWKIKNYSFSSFNDILYSPPFFVDALEGTEWTLMLDRYEGKDNVCCRIQRTDVSGPDILMLDYELSFLAADESVLRPVIFKKKEYTKGHSDAGSELCAQRVDILTRNKDLFIPDDVLTIRCRMWNSKESILEARRCFAETQIETDCRSYVGTIEKFSSIERSCKTSIYIKSSPMKNFFSSMNLCVSADGKLGIEIKPEILFNTKVKNVHKCKWRCEIFIRDVSGNKIKCGQGEFHGTKFQCISLILPKEHLMENKEYYLPNDVLTLECDVIFPTGEEIKKLDEGLNPISLAHEQTVFPTGNSIEEIDEPECGFVCKGTQTMISNSEEYLTGSFKPLKDDLISLVNHRILYDEPECGFVCKETQTMMSNSEEYLTGSFTTLKDDLISLINHRILCDVELKAETETFSAHKIVLSARSPVFKAMFTTDMKEKTNKDVEIDDLDADTVRRMLLFIYSDILEDLEYESVKSLYIAADKYNIVSLSRRCSNFLKQNLQQSNCCDILLLADKHQDQYLKNTIQDYITKGGKAVLLSEEWKNLEEDHPRLTTEFFRAMYLNNLGK